MQTIIVDSRQQDGKHDIKHKQMQDMGYKLLTSKLPLGDYAFINDLSVVVDTKKDILELIMDMHKDHKRFRNECILALENKIQLFIMVEEIPPNNRIDEWKSPIWKSDTRYHSKGQKVTNTDMVAFRKSLITMQEKYGVKFLFCDKKDTGKKIVELLKGNQNEKKI